MSVVPRFDLNGVWVDGGNGCQIVHDLMGQDVRATFFSPYWCDPGDGAALSSTLDDFSGKLAGDVIAGHTMTCRWGTPDAGLREAPMRLTVLEDGNVLDGEWRDGAYQGHIEVIRCRRWLEHLDSERWENQVGPGGDGLSSPPTRKSWFWPASFYVDAQGTSLLVQTGVSLDGSGWLRHFLSEVPASPLQKGDVVLFNGTSLDPGRRELGAKIAHSAIAIGTGDEVSHLWWSRHVQSEMTQGDRIHPPPSEGSVEDHYAISRDSIADLKRRFTDPTGSYVFNSYKVFRNPSLGRFDDLAGEDACRAALSPARRDRGSGSTTLVP